MGWNMCHIQAILNTYGIVTQTPDELEPMEVWSQAQMVKVYQMLGSSPILGLKGRPPRPIGALGSSKVRWRGKSCMYNC